MKLDANYFYFSLLLYCGGCAVTPEDSNESEVLATLGHSSANHSSETNGDESARELLMKGDEALSAGDLDTAQVKYSLALSEDEKNIDALYKLAQIHYLKDSYSVAQSLIERVLLEEPNSVGALETLGLIALKTEHYADAELYCYKALEIQAGSWRSLNALGIIKDVQGMHVEAQSRFQEALKSVPNSLQVINNLGYSYYLQGNYSAAQRTFLKATRMDKNYDKAWSNLGLTFIRQKRYDEARAAFGKLVEPHVAANNLGYLSMLQGDLSTARVELDMAIRVAPQYYALANENISLLEHQGASDANSAEALASTDASQSNLDLVIIPASANPAMRERPVAPAVDSAVRRKDNSEIDSTKTALVNTKPSAKASMPKASPAAKTSVSIADYLQFLGYGQLSAATSTRKQLHDATLSFQINHGLQTTGRAGPKTDKLLRSMVQQRLNEHLNARGYLSDVTVASSEDIERATRSFEQDHGLKPDGLIDPELLQKLPD